jgi:Putative peptidoglycan binding domain
MADRRTRPGTDDGNGGRAQSDDEERAESAVDDWQWDWVDTPAQAREQPRPPPEPARPVRTGIVPRGGAAAEQGSPADPKTAVVRRRRLAALVALGLLFALALVIPLVVFGGGDGAAEQTRPPPATTSTLGTTSSDRQATTTTTTTATPPPEPSGTKSPLRVSLPESGKLRRGDRGSMVGELQRGLAALGFAVGAPDNIFGSTTELAVIDFQRSNDLAPDGVAGTDTVRLLNAALAKKGVTA